jgi:hypothetical protein
MVLQIPPAEQSPQNLRSKTEKIPFGALSTSSDEWASLRAI